MSESIGFYLHILYWYKYRATYILLKKTFKQQHTFKFYKYTFKQQQAQAAKYFEVQATKQSVAISTLFVVDAVNWTFLYLILLASLE